MERPRSDEDDKDEERVRREGGGGLGASTCGQRSVVYWAGVVEDSGVGPRVVGGSRERVAGEGEDGGGGRSRDCVDVSGPLPDPPLGVSE